MRNPSEAARAAAWMMSCHNRSIVEAARMFCATQSQIKSAVRQAEGARAFTRQMMKFVESARIELAVDETLKPSELGKKIGVAAGCAKMIMLEVQFSDLRKLYAPPA